MICHFIGEQMNVNDDASVLKKIIVRLIADANNPKQQHFFAECS